MVDLPERATADVLPMLDEAWTANETPQTVQVTQKIEKRNGNDAKLKHLTRVIMPTKENLNKVLWKYERDLSMAPAKVPLADIHTNVEQFQIRSTPYSEESVHKIISAIKKWNFVKELFNPSILRHNQEENKLYVLAGHSRKEAFRRLSDPMYIDQDSGQPLYEHPGVQTFVQQTWIDFTWVRALIAENKSMHDAKRIAAISNTLWTPESLVDRAYYYQAERGHRGLTDQQLEKEYKVLEGRNRYTVLALSYLNVNGKCLTTLGSFVGNDDAHKDLMKVCKWIWEAKRKYSCLNIIHEDELFDWLFEGEKYGFGKKNISTQSVFLKTLHDHIEKLQKKWAFRSDRKLNISGKKKYSFALQQYERALGSYNRLLGKETKAKERIEKEIVDINVMKNKGVVDAEIERKLVALHEKLESKRVEVIQMRVNMQLAENLRFEFKGKDKLRLQTALEIFSITYSKKEDHKKNRSTYIEAEKSQTSLFFMMDSGEEWLENEEEVQHMQ